MLDQDEGVAYDEETQRRFGVVVAYGHGNRERMIYEVTGWTAGVGLARYLSLDRYTRITQRT